ncbi:hypothetical protein yc1106_04234 [Curvularia clavata]|uniref:Leucine-rich repeat domain-containing protein n=1 Tax=Curvularia clavata TaxID=95742 RepID=A0A9Q9DSF1_CURCL|nr:hypothetical protein yc1106_04234 [Curvularia clavata]
MANPSPLPAHGSTSPNAASLSGIPDELLLNIIVHLHDDEDALAKLCRTDKRCKRFAQEVLYGFIRKDRAARAVARWPWLAKDVRFLECWLQEPTDKEIYLRILEYACGVRGIRMDLRHYKFSIQPMVLACLGLFNKAVDRPMDSPNQFSRLKYILIGNGSLLASPLPMKNMSTLFRLPALEHLRLRGFYQTTPFRDWTVSTSTSSIKCLWIFDSMMDVTAVVQMVQSVKALQNFGYEYSTRHWEPFGREDIPVSHLPAHFWKPLGDAMKQHQYSLKCLKAFETVDKALAHNGYPDGRNVGFFGSFADFPQLEHIHLPIESLLDIQAGEDDLSRYLPKQLLHFSGIIDSSNP